MVLTRRLKPLTKVVKCISIYSIIWATARSSFTQVSTLKNMYDNRSDKLPPDVRGQRSLSIKLIHPIPTHHLLMNKFDSLRLLQGAFVAVEVCRQLTKETCFQSNISTLEHKLSTGTLSLEQVDCTLRKSIKCLLQLQ